VFFSAAKIKKIMSHNIPYGIIEAIINAYATTAVYQHGIG
jgi:hypothetical protein